MRKTLLATVLAATLVLGATSLAWAIVNVTQIIVSSSADSADASIGFPKGTTSVWVIFDYVGAANEKVTVSVDAPSGLPDLFVSTSKSLTGDGTEAVEVAGAKLYERLTARLEEWARKAEGDVGKVKTQTNVKQYLLEIHLSEAQIDSILRVLETIEDDLDSEQRDQLSELWLAVDELGDLVNEALDLPPDDLEPIRALAEQMEAPAETLVTNARALGVHADSVTEMSLPDGEYTVQAMVRDSPSNWTEFHVSGREQPSARPSASPNPTGSGSQVDPTAEPKASDTPSSGFVPENPATATAIRAGAETEEAQGAEATTAAGGTTALLDPVRSTTATARAVSGEQGGTATAAVGQPTAVQGNATAPEAPAAPSEGEQAAGDRGDEQASAPAGQPTWTVPADTTLADASGGTSVDEPAGGLGGSGGPNLAILLTGAVVLAGMAFWLRQRL